MKYIEEVKNERNHAISNRGYYMPACGYKFNLILINLNTYVQEDLKFVSTSGHVTFCLLYILYTTEIPGQQQWHLQWLIWLDWSSHENCDIITL